MNSRNTTVRISVQAYAHNLSYFQELLRPVTIAPVVKADGYGHGAIPLARIAASLGCEYLCVAFLEEAVSLREAGISIPILVLNYFDPQYIPIFIQYHLTATLFSFEQYERILSFKDEGVLKVHLKIDTGMNRLGIRPEEIGKMVSALKRSTDRIELEGMYTHLATADETDSVFALQQYRSFEQIVKTYRNICRFYHISNSAAALYLKENLFDFVRLGIASYGLDARNHLRPDALKPVLTWESVLSHVKLVQKGESISYGRTFIASKEMLIGTVPVGYADGYNRLLSNRGEVLVRGKRCKITGRVCMDQFMIDVSSIPEAKMGDSVILLGKSDTEEISAEEIAGLISTINYEVTCAISKRVPRIYEN